MSDWIVHARVVGERDSTYVHSEQVSIRVTVAQLEVIEVFKRPGVDSASSGQDTKLEVPYQPGWVCPEPPNYPLGGTVLAFLSEPDSSGYYRTVGLSHGTKAPSYSEVPGWRSAITEYLEHLQVEDSEARLRLSDWFLRHLQIAGVGDLLAREVANARDGWTGRDQPPPRSQWKPQFTPEQRQHLAQAMREDPDWKYRGISQFLLYPLCVEYADEASLRYMVASLVERGAVPWQLYDFLIVLSDRLGQRGCRIIAEDIAEITGPDVSKCGQLSARQAIAKEVLECLR